MGNFAAQGPANCNGINATATAGPFATGSLFGIIAQTTILMAGIVAASGGDRVKEITGFGLIGIVGIVVAAILA